MLLPSFVKKLETLLVDFGFVATAFVLGTTASGGGMAAVVLVVAAVELVVVELAEVGAVVVPLVVELESDPVFSGLTTILGLAWAVPKIVAGVVVVAVGLAVATGVETGEVGVRVPAGVRLDGSLVVVVGAVVVKTPLDGVVTGTFDNQSTVTLAPSIIVDLEAVTTVCCGVDGVEDVCVVAGSKSVYSGKVKPGWTPLSTLNFIGEMLRYFLTADAGTHSNFGRMCCRATVLR